MAAKWYYQTMGEEIGPHSFEELQALAKSGRITADTLVIQGTENWRLADGVPGLLSDEPANSAGSHAEIEFVEEGTNQKKHSTAVAWTRGGKPPIASRRPRRKSRQHPSNVACGVVAGVLIGIATVGFVVVGLISLSFVLIATSQQRPRFASQSNVRHDADHLLELIMQVEKEADQLAGKVRSSYQDLSLGQRQYLKTRGVADPDSRRGMYCLAERAIQRRLLFESSKRVVAGTLREWQSNPETLRRLSREFERMDNNSL